MQPLANPEPFRTPYREMTEEERDTLAERQMTLDRRGEALLPEVARVQVPLVDVKALRARLELSQAAFAAAFGFTVDTVQNWEQRRRIPDRATRTLLRMIEADPEAVRRFAREG